jgi:GntR family transcriptional regulator / MocR family aminotransferase
MRHRAALTIPIRLDRQAPTPLYEQIAEQVGSAVGHGALPGASQLPSVRTLAELLGVSRGVVEAAYDLMFARGLLEVRAGSGTFVAARRVSPTPFPPPPVTTGVVDLTPDQSAVDVVPLPDWRSAWRRAGFGGPPRMPPHPFGLADLRRAVAAHLRRTRGGQEPGTEIVITQGTAHGLRTVLDALGLDGPRVALAEPTAPALRRAVPGTPVALPVDAEGARVDTIPAGCRAVVVSSDGQHPLGIILSVPRRLGLAAWARGTGGQVIEIACDHVPRPEASWMPRLAALTNGGSIVVGGFGELLTPALELGYAVVPREIAGVLAERIVVRAEQPMYVAQLALAALLDGGTVTRIRHRLARRYSHQRALVDSALSTLDGVRQGVSAAVLHLRDRTPYQAVVDLLGRGVRVGTITPYYFATAPPAALILGYGHLPDATLRHALSVLVSTLS